MSYRTHITPANLPKEILDPLMDTFTDEAMARSTFVERMAGEKLPDYVKAVVDAPLIGADHFDGDTLSVVTLDSIPDNGPREEITKPRLFNNREKRRADRKNARRQHSKKSNPTRAELIARVKY